MKSDEKGAMNMRQIKKYLPRFYLFCEVVSVILFWGVFFIGLVAGSLWSGLSVGFNIGRDI
jgi:polyferredoxin